MMDSSVEMSSAFPASFIGKKSISKKVWVTWSYKALCGYIIPN